jgi:hypothetical protein
MCTKGKSQAPANQTGNTKLALTTFTHDDGIIIVGAITSVVSRRNPGARF